MEIVIVFIGTLTALFVYNLLAHWASQRKQEHREVAQAHYESERQRRADEEADAHSREQGYPTRAERQERYLRSKKALQDEYLASIGQPPLPDEFDYQRSADFFKAHREAFSSWQRRRREERFDRFRYEGLAASPDFSERQEAAEMAKRWDWRVPPPEPKWLTYYRHNLGADDAVLDAPDALLGEEKVDLERVSVVRQNKALFDAEVAKRSTHYGSQAYIASLASNWGFAVPPLPPVNPNTTKFFVIKDKDGNIPEMPSDSG